MADFSKLPTFGDGGHVRMVVESPRGASVKLKFDPKLFVFTVGRPLALGLTYPFDWGFIPGTMADDGDPLDALAIHDTATYPGIVLTCRVLGVVDVTQKGPKGQQKNPRLILVPTWHERLGALKEATGLPPRVMKEIEQFFVSATFFTGKDPRIKGWRGPEAAQELIRSCAAPGRCEQCNQPC